MKKLNVHFFGAIFFGAVVVAGSPDSAMAELNPNVIARIRTIIQKADGGECIPELTAFVLVVPEFATKIAAVAARMRPGLTLDVFCAVAAASPANAVNIAAALAGAAPYMRMALKAKLSEFLIANADTGEPESGNTETGQLASRHVPEISTFLRDTLEESIVISPTI